MTEQNTEQLKKIEEIKFMFSSYAHDGGLEAGEIYTFNEQDLVKRIIPKLTTPSHEEIKPKKETGINEPHKHYLFQSVNNEGGFELRHCSDRLRDGWKYVGDITEAVKTSHEEIKREAVEGYRKKLQFAFSQESGNGSDTLEFHHLQDRVFKEYLTQSKERRE